MHRPLRTPFYLRVWNLIKGILLYNTVYWEKASDGLNLPTLTREEREQKRPKANLEIIKPREKPRARMDAFRGAQVSKPDYEAQISQPSEGTEAEAVDANTGAEAKPGRAEGTYVKRRKYKRRRPAGAAKEGIFQRIFGRPL